MNKWKAVNKFRKYWTLILILLGVISIVVGQLITEEMTKGILNCIGTSLISAAITIFLIKFDIMDMMQADVMDRYGIRNIYNGRDDVLSTNGNKMKSWTDFLKKSSDKTIDIVGISMYSFLFTNKLDQLIKELVDKEYKIRIIFANPESEEVRLQSIEENKEGKLKENIKWLSEKMRKEIVSSNLEIMYSATMPRAFIIRSGREMIVTPYLLNGPFKEPTIWSYANRSEDNTYYETYLEYINKLVQSAEILKLD